MDHDNYGYLPFLSIDVAAGIAMNLAMKKIPDLFLSELCGKGNAPSDQQCRSNTTSQITCYEGSSKPPRRNISLRSTCNLFAEVRDVAPHRISSKYMYLEITFAASGKSWCSDSAGALRTRMAKNGALTIPYITVFI
ncbi:hypothetical protein AVEN_43912-1 [Araneus ventricosus]|uniref:Uncharacterized protein n=1 Tax=Araneus ventricosus TaxID=182803 RepID=A0A4Y2PNR9_ARAVE|nr:hypothetical protein AVEN_171699-1 [Araneus ventricosus]GBN54290.1 hypothetical protein AVEN_43912-1 [Araneus ventricosus]